MSFSSLLSLVSFVLLQSSREWTWIGLSCIIINDSSDQLVPFLLVVLPQMLSDLDDQAIQRLDSAINIAFLRVSYGPELVFLFNHFGEVPKFRRSAHVLPLHAVMDGLHMF